MAVTVRPYRATDENAVRTLLIAAFGQPDEAALVDALRSDDSVLGEWVATENGRVVGHIVYSRAELAHDDGTVAAALLAPMAIDPKRQRAGIGTVLAEQSLSALGQPLVFVLGHPGYYPRFGFSNDKAQHVSNPWTNGPAFMVLCQGRGPTGTLIPARPFRPTG